MPAPSRPHLDPESRAGLDRLQALIPVKPNDIPDLAERRQVLIGIMAAVMAATPRTDRVVSSDEVVPGAAEVRVRIYRPVGAGPGSPGVLLIHGGGMIAGSIDTDELIALRLADELGAVVVSPEYRLAPEHPYPAALDDCGATLRWFVQHAARLGVDPARLMIYGASAGGGLALATALANRDSKAVSLALVMAIFPMVDDRNDTPSSHEITDIGIWDRKDNLEAWTFYLGGIQADGYAAPARMADLSGLPPVFIDVGTADLFRDEDIDLAARLVRAGVPTELHVYPGAFHGSESISAEASLSQQIWAARISALHRALDPSAPGGQR